MNNEQFVGSQLSEGYETPEHKPYSELGTESEKEWDSWGNVIVTNENGSQERMSYYTNERIASRLFTDAIMANLSGTESERPLSLVDFGGGDGILLHQVNQQLQERGVAQTTPILIERDEDKLGIAREKFPELQAVEGDIFKLPFADNSVDIGISRQVLQYLPPPKENDDRLNQFDMLKEIYRVMKPCSTLVLVWTGNYKYSSQQEKSKADATDNMWLQVTYDRTDKAESAEPEEPPPFVGIPAKRHFTPGEVMTDYAQRAGFEVKAGEEIDWIEFRFTYDALLDRFGENIPEENKQWMTGIFNSDMVGAFKRSGVDVIEWHNKPAFRIPISRLILHKPERSNDERLP